MGLLLSRKGRRHIKGYGDLERIVASNASEVEAYIHGLRESSGMIELERAVDAGLLDIDRLDLDPIRLTQESVLAALGRSTNAVSSRVVDTYVGRVSAAVAKGSGTYPLFDRGTSEIVELMIRERRLKGASTRPAGEIALAGRYIGYMPTFPDATVDEVLDVRRGLHKPLIRFRGAMATMASAVEPHAWDLAFAAEADRLYRAEVAPALLDLEENARELGAFALVRDAVTSGRPWATLAGGMGLVLTAAGLVPDLAQAALGVGVPASVSAAVIAGTAEAARKAMRHERIAEQNRFVFLSRANADLRRGP
jgi:hypothetical protein